SSSSCHTGLARATCPCRTPCASCSATRSKGTCCALRPREVAPTTVANGCRRMNSSSTSRRASAYWDGTYIFALFAGRFGITSAAAAHRAACRSLSPGPPSVPPARAAVPWIVLVPAPGASAQTERGPAHEVDQLSWKDAEPQNEKRGGREHGLAGRRNAGGLVLHRRIVRLEIQRDEHAQVIEKPDAAADDHKCKQHPQRRLDACSDHIELCDEAHRQRDSGQRQQHQREHG